MAGGAFDQDDEITDINITPMVDVMLVLLIIFMVTASYIVHKSIAVKLPQAETAENMSTKNIAFTIDDQGQLYLDGEKIAFSDIAKRILDFKTMQKDAPQNLQALISADEKTPHGLVVNLIDTVRKNGITEFAINVEAATKLEKLPSSGGSP